MTMSPEAEPTVQQTTACNWGTEASMSQLAVHNWHDLAGSP